MEAIRRRWLVPWAAIIAGTALAAGCSSASSGSGSGNGSGSGTTAGTGSNGGSYSVSAGVLHAFSGQNAFFGLNALASCKAAAEQINAAGGVLGHQLSCPVYDTKGDPADAVPVTTRMLATASHLVMVVGPDGNDIPSVLPLLQQAKIPEMNTVGDTRYDKQTNQDFWRLTPSDSTQAPALAYEAIHKGYTKIVEVYTNDLSAQTTTGPFAIAYSKLGGTILKNLTITPDQASYQTEVAAALAAHPRAIIGEMDARTAATFLSELKQQNGGMIPFVVTQRATQGDWAPAVQPAIGSSSMASDVFAVAPALSSTGAAYAAFQQAMTAIKATKFQVKNPFAAASYDGVIAFALAMDAAKSTDPAVWVPFIAKVTSPSSGDTVVSTYAEGLAALKAGKTIQYVGASGLMVFNPSNTADRPYAIYTFNPATFSWAMGQILPQDAGQ
jgi:ABC-type branched-subunit amino acid transport system substrate-binding protein